MPQSKVMQRLNEALNDLDIDINHPSLTNFRAWLETATNGDIAGVNRYLFQLASHGIQCTPKRLSKTYQQAEKISELITLLYEQHYGPSVKLNMQRQGDEITCTREVNPARLPEAFVNIIFDFMKTVALDSYKTDHQLEVLAFLIRETAKHLETKESTENEATLADADWSERFLQDCYARRADILNPGLDINHAFLSYFAAQRSNPGADNRLQDYTQPETTLTAKTGAIVPYMGK